MGMKLADLSPEIQDALAKTEPGEADAALHVAGRRRDDRALRQARTEAIDRLHHADAPARSKSSCSSSRSPMLARRYMRDLRRDANVETR